MKTEMPLETRKSSSGSNMVTKESIVKGLKWAIPYILGMMPIGATYGLLARQVGLGLLPTLGLSLFVFAGSAQLIAVSMLSKGIAPLVIVGTTFVVNFRHVLMSASVAPYLTSWSLRRKFLLGGMLTDESFVLHSTHFSGGDQDPAAAITLNAAGYIVWALCGFLGYRLGALIENPEVWGLDFALPAMFVGLLLPVCTSRAAVVAAICAGTASIALYCLGFGTWAAFTGGLVGATVGVFVKEKPAVKKENDHD